MPAFESERRDYVKLKSEVTVRYKFLSREVEIEDKIREGFTTNLGGGGMLLVGQIPEPNWYEELLRERVVMGLNILLPSEADPVKTIGHVVWIEGHPDLANRVGIGLTFKEIAREARDAILRFVIRAQLR